jgi:hypothetical protein
MGGLGLTAVEQAYLDQARQMQAPSFVVHIPLVCFGIAFRSWSCSSSGVTSAPVTSSTGLWRSAGAGSWWRCSR